jgi:hypothetical protein
VERREQQLAEPVMRAASEQGLGNLVETVPLGQAPVWLDRLGGAVAGLAVVIPMGWSLAAGRGRWIPVFVAFAVLSVMAVPAGIMWDRRRSGIVDLVRWRGHLHVFERGFVGTARRRIVVFTWDDVVHVAHHPRRPYIPGGRVTMPGHFDVMAADGRQITFKAATPEAASFGERVEQIWKDRGERPAGHYG